MPQYTTGELARSCGVSVRTVQFYDAKDLLKPSGLTEGGRRLYSDADLDRLRMICMLKALGLALGSIKGILDSDKPEKVLLLLLEEQERQIGREMKDRQRQLDSILAVRESIRSTGRIPVDSIGGMERMRNGKKKLKKTHAAMLILGVLMDAVQIGALILWIARGMWRPFAAGMPLVILLGVLMTWMYCKNTDYICAECNTQFKPALREFLFSGHTPKTRKLKCPNCGHVGYCVETASEK